MLASYRPASGRPPIPMPLHPPQRIALKTSEPLFGHFRPDKHFLLAREGVVARLTLPRPHHVFTQLPGPFSHGQIQPCGRERKRHLVCAPPITLLVPTFIVGLLSRYYFAANSGAVCSAISAPSSTTTIRRRFGAGTNFR